MFPNSSGGSMSPAYQSIPSFTGSLKRERSNSENEISTSSLGYSLPWPNNFESSAKRRRPSPYHLTRNNSSDITFQLSCRNTASHCSLPMNPFAQYQPTPPSLESDSDSPSEFLEGPPSRTRVDEDEDMVDSIAMSQSSLSSQSWISKTEGDVGDEKSRRNPNAAEEVDMDVDGQTTRNREEVEGTKQNTVGGKGRGKPTYRMGYVASCEKCRLKVPGHYGHFL